VSCDLLVWLPGVSTDAAPSYTRPACWEHPFNPALAPERRTAGKPTYTYRWSGRFSPLVAGTHHARLRFVDANGTRYTETVAFEATTSTHPGPVRVSPTDRRFFEFENGTTLPARAGIHINAGLPESLLTQLGLPPDALISAALPPGLFILQRDFWASEHPEKAWAGFSGAGGQKDWRGGGFPADDGQGGICMLVGKAPGPAAPRLAVEILDKSRATGFSKLATFEVRAVVQVVPGAVPERPNGDYGAAILVERFNERPPIVAAATTRAQAQSGKFVEIAGRFTMEDDYLDRAQAPLLCFSNVREGQLKWKAASLKRVQADGTLGGELYQNPRPDVRRYYDQRAADLCDRTLAYAASRGEYLKPIIFSYLDLMWNTIQPNGRIGLADHNNFYGPTDASVLTPGRWYQRAAIRYFIARWGWSPHIWAVEFVNEGDPFNGHHFGGAEHFARYVHEVSEKAGRRLLASTSFWHSQSDFWHTASTDFVDVHQYPGHIGGQGNPQLNRPAWEFPVTVRDHKEPGRNEVLVAKRGAQTIYDFKSTPVKAGQKYRVRYFLRTVGLKRGGGVEGPHVSPGWLLAHSGKQPHPRQWDSMPYAFYQNLNNDLPPDSDWFERITPSSVAPERARYIGIRIELKGDRVAGEVRFDDVRLENLTTGEVAPLLNGNFDYSRWYRDDTALFMEAAWREYAGGGAVPRVFDKPWMIGEDSPGPVESDAAATNEQFLLAYRKRLWAAALSPGQPYSMLWWAQGLVERGAWAPFQAVQSFLSPYLSGPGRLSSGEWKDARPACVVTGNAGKLRAIGQVNRAQGMGMIWVDNADHILGNVRDGIAVAPVSGTVSVPVPNGTYRVQRFSTSNGLAQGTSAMQKVTRRKTGPVRFRPYDRCRLCLVAGTQAPLPPSSRAFPTIFVAPSGRVYHRMRAHAGAKAKTVTFNEARAQRLRACSVCKPPVLPSGT
jgi:hypothetical protein